MLAMNVDIKLIYDVIIYKSYIQTLHTPRPPRHTQPPPPPHPHPYTHNANQRHTINDNPRLKHANNMHKNTTYIYTLDIYIQYKTYQIYHKQIFVNASTSVKAYVHIKEN